MLARETLTERAWMRRWAALERRLARALRQSDARPMNPDRKRRDEWQTGMTASRQSGFEGTIRAVDTERGRATFQLGRHDRWTWRSPSCFE